MKTLINVLNYIFESETRNGSIILSLDKSPKKVIHTAVVKCVKSKLN